ncbi:hypothetical protein KY290_013426 [Solanum tuberosum]|uniref:Uncharacterized protein n=1 Tax=Solanum tuberosum TaxID=4113 RepID=A0ABQ7VMC4_SOLTU|nr:hypothetical protein KY285_012888 [Solanum tuberosum]KAH0769445.1 hypothetical protein KY290_013426 [Solanum tuberosum]
MDVYANKPIKANYTVVQEFNANAAETGFSGGLVFRVRGKQVLIDSTRINNYYGLLDDDNEVHMATERKAAKSDL